MEVRRDGLKEVVTYKSRRGFRSQLQFLKSTLKGFDDDTYYAAYSENIMKPLAVITSVVKCRLFKQWLLKQMKTQDSFLKILRKVNLLKEEQGLSFSKPQKPKKGQPPKKVNPYQHETFEKDFTFTDL